MVAYLSNINHSIIKKISFNKYIISFSYFIKRRVNSKIFFFYLQILVKQKMITPTHGGAVPVRFIQGEMDYQQKIKTRLKEKTAIAKRAAEMVEDETCILLMLAQRHSRLPNFCCTGTCRLLPLICTLPCFFPSLRA